MNEFGTLLRFYREKSEDKELQKGKLTQARLGELLGQALGMVGGYSGAAVSDWERGVSRIDKDDRQVLMQLIIILYQGGGLKGPDEADTFLKAGNYSALNKEEFQEVFPNQNSYSFPIPSSTATDQVLLIRIQLGETLLNPLENFRDVFIRPEGEPPLDFSEIITRMLGWPGNHITSSGVLRGILWIVVWLLTWLLTFPLMYWSDGAETYLIPLAFIYMAGATVIPLMIGVLVRTLDNPFWKNQELVDTLVLRLYTHQGAMVGFHVGYFMVFAAALFGYYFGIPRLPLWLQIAAAGWPVILGYAAANQVPLNLWRAFHRLELSDGSIFFIFGAWGLIFGLGFLLISPLLLLVPEGPLMVVVAVTAVAGLTTLMQRRTGSGIIPAHVWAFIFGTLIILQTAASGANLFQVSILVGVFGIVILLLAHDRILVTLKGLVGFAVGLALLLLAFRANLWLGRLLFLAVLGFWWRWGKAYFWLPYTFWGVIAAAVFAALLIQNGTRLESGTIVFCLLTLIIVLVEIRITYKRVSP